MMFALRSVPLGLLSLVPNGLPILTTFGAWALLVGAGLLAASGQQVGGLFGQLAGGRQIFEAVHIEQVDIFAIDPDQVLSGHFGENP